MNVYILKHNNKFYTGFDSIHLKPLWTTQVRFALRLTEQNAKAAEKQLKLLGFPCELVED